MVEEFMVEEFMVEEFMVEEFMVESEKILGSNDLQPGSGGSGISCKVAAAGSGG
jgi:hypothetical protein